MIIAQKDLQLGDLVTCFVGPYASATVVKVEAEVVTVVRPHIVTGDYETSGGLPWSIGVETFTMSRSNRLIEVVDRKVGYGK